MLNQNSWGIVDESAAVLMMLFCSACLVPSFGGSHNYGTLAGLNPFWNSFPAPFFLGWSCTEQFIDGIFQ